MYVHGLTGNILRGGTLLDLAFELRDNGLYAEAELEDNEAGHRAHDLVSRGRGAWSSATLPHLAVIRKDDGFVERWPLVEGSILDVDQAGSWPGTTTVNHLRAVWPGADIQASDENLKRGRWVMPIPNGGTPPQEETQGATVDVTALQQSVTTLTETVNTLVETVQDPALRALPQTDPPPTTPTIEVSHRYDGVTLWGMLWHDSLQEAKHRANNKTAFKPYQRDNEFMRALVDKIRRTYDKQQPDDPGIRAIDAQAYQAWHDVVPHLRANEAMQSDLAGSGDELVPTMLSSVAHYEFRMASRVWGLLNSMMIPTNPYDYPIISGGPRLRLVAEASDRAQADLAASVFPDGKPTTSKVTFLANKMGVLTLESLELFEDAGIDTANMLSQQFARNVARDVDWVLLNGDERTGATNISHSADPTGTEWDSALVLDGLRRIAQADSNTNDFGAALTVADDLVLRALMGGRGIIGLDIANIVAVCSPGLMYDMLALTNFQTYDQLGDRAVLLTGQVGNWRGIPVVVSDELELTDGDGLYPENHTSGVDDQLLFIHRPSLMVGLRRDVTMEMSRPAHTDMIGMSVSLRLDLQSMEDGSVAWGYDFSA